jgi:hypothetical protein
MRVSAQVAAAAMSRMGNASNQREDLSTNGEQVPVPAAAGGHWQGFHNVHMSEASGWDGDGLHRCHGLPLEALALSHCWPSLHQAVTLLLSPCHMTLAASVADPGCLSRIPDPNLYPSRIPDLGSRIQKQ